MTPNARPITARLAFALLWLFVFLIPMAQATEFRALGALSHAVWPAGIVAGMIAVVRRRQMRLLEPLHLAMAAFILWSTVTLSWSIMPELTVQRVTAYLQLFVLVLLVWEMCVEEKEVLWLLGAFVLGAIVPTLSTLYGFLLGRPTLIERASMPGYDANQLAFLLALTVPAAYFLVLRETGPVIWLYGLQMGLAVSAILLTGSPGAMIAMAIGLSMAFWNFPRPSLYRRAVLCAIVPLFAVIAFLGIHADEWTGAADEVRQAGVNATLAMDRELGRLRATPIRGLGAGTLAQSVTAASYRSESHPTSFIMFAETGVIGVACFGSLLVGLAAAAARMQSTSKGFWLTLLAVWMVGAVSLNWESSPAGWLIFGLLAAHSACRIPKSAASDRIPMSYDLRESIRVFS